MIEVKQHWFCGQTGPEHHHILKLDAARCMEQQVTASLVRASNIRPLPHIATEDEIRASHAVPETATCF